MGWFRAGTLRMLDGSFWFRGFAFIMGSVVGLSRLCLWGHVVATKTEAMEGSD